MRESIEAIQEYVKDLSEQDFNGNRQVQDAVTRRI